MRPGVDSGHRPRTETRSALEGVAGEVGREAGVWHDAWQPLFSRSASTLRRHRRAPRTT